ncbi:hypothetical protein, partial [Pseudomonas aeruginosa]|uniref:hypothetical protein n=1 Tax=Pseudomonas aeruginosa TaxID=287 RepID=UPI00307F20C7
ILRCWPSLDKPTDVLACQKWIMMEWRKHGYPIGMSPEMFLFYVLAMRHAYPNGKGKNDF